MDAGGANIIGVDTRGGDLPGRKQHMNFVKEWYAENTNPRNVKGNLWT